MNREYYIYWYQFDYKKAYLIWFSTDDKDGFLVDENGFIPSFENIENLRNYAHSKQIVVNTEDPNFFNLDVIQDWVNKNLNKIEDYNAILNVWNLFDDISFSTNGNFDKIGHYNIYERIFWGCNIPAMTPEGESFTPTWTKKELKIIRETLKLGFQMFVEKVKDNFPK
jgi:hypothetical protein